MRYVGVVVRACTPTFVASHHTCRAAQFACQSQVKFHGYDPSDAIIEVHPREGEHTIRTEDILAEIRRHGDSVATVLFSGVQYYTGQAFDIGAITKVAHEVGATMGVDLGA